MCCINGWHKYRTFPTSWITRGGALEPQVPILAECDLDIRLSPSNPLRDCRWPGSVHDTKAWESGAVHRNPDLFYSPGQYQLGDSGFTLTKRMLVPFRLPAASSPQNDEFNKRLSQARVVSEHGN